MDTVVIDTYVQEYLKKSKKEDKNEQNKEMKTDGVISLKDGLVERINKKYVTDDGKQLLND